MTEITIFQRRQAPRTKQQIIICVPKLMEYKVTTYIIKIGGVETEQKCYKVKSPLMDSVVREILEMGKGHIYVTSRKSSPC